MGYAPKQLCSKVKTQIAMRDFNNPFLLRYKHMNPNSFDRAMFLVLVLPS